MIFKIFCFYFAKILKTDLKTEREGRVNTSKLKEKKF